MRQLVVVSLTLLVMAAQTIHGANKASRKPVPGVMQAAAKSEKGPAGEPMADTAAGTNRSIKKGDTTKPAATATDTVMAGEKTADAKSTDTGAAVKTEKPARIKRPSTFW